MNLASLEKQFGSPSVRFVEKSGFIRVEVANAAANASISTYGAHITDFTPNGERPVLWMSEHSWYEPGKPIRGGIPICWPWFGPAQNPDFPAHGFARISQWEVESIESAENNTETRVVLRLTPEMLRDRSLAAFDFEAKVEFIIGSSLVVTLMAKNKSPELIVVSDALHSYFAVEEAAKIRVRGLGDTGYEDRVVDAPIVLGNVQTANDLRVDREIDRIYYTTGAVEIVDPGFDRTIRIEKRGSATTVAWNPWIRKSKAMPDFGDEEYHGMFCVEAVNAAADFRTILPGEWHRISQKISLV